MERLSAQDLMMLWPEERGWSQDIGALAILDGSTLLDAEGRFPIERVRDRIRERLYLVPVSGSCCTGRGSDWAGRCGSTPRPST